MSAWIVTNKSINNIVNTFYWFKYPFYGGRTELKELFNIDLEQHNDEDLNEELKKFGQLLINLNQESINQRYEKKDKPFKFKFSDVKSLSIFQFLKSVECLIYQSCEGNCEDKKEYKFLVNLKRALTSKIINEIEEYKNAKWE